MNMNREEIRQALESDAALLQAAAKLYQDSVQRFCGCLPDMEKIKAKKAEALRDELYQELELLKNPQAWSKAKAGQIMEAGEADKYTAALAYLASLACAPDNREISKQITTRKLSVHSQADCEKLTALFSEIPMSGLFFSEQEIPCLADEKIRRLALLLGFMVYCSRLEEGAEVIFKFHPEITLEAMLIWSFACVELMCSAASEEKRAGYAEAVCCVACANLPYYFWCDNWTVLKECLDSMYSSREIFGEMLRDIAENLDAELGEHISVAARPVHETKLLEMFAVMNRSKGKMNMYLNNMDYGYADE